jgi:glyoxylase-like metal-dependent hydrolase (beta-lactamase superfamily II)
MEKQFHSFTVGNFTCTLISDGFFAYSHPAHSFFFNAAPSVLADALSCHQIDAPNWQTYQSPYSALLIDTGRHRLLVDTGAGAFAPTAGKLMDNLGVFGVAPQEIDTVILTHGHADHVGANLDANGKPAFPKAQYLIARAEWDFWSGNPDLAPLPLPAEIKHFLIDFARSNLLPLRDQIELFDGDVEILPGICTLAAPGHTPGHTALSITSAGEQLLYLVDTVLHPIHIEHPQWVAAFDFDPDQTIATRRRLLQRAADEKALVLAYHFPAPGLGTVVAQGDGWAWQPC